MVDRLVETAAVEDEPVYIKISREVIMTRVKENGLNLWQQKWTNTGKGAVTKAFFRQ
jgi:TPP-dependent 2-oxoacid decarboxylase